MSALLILFLVWLPISSVVYFLVNAVEGTFKNTAKKILFLAVTFPTAWFFELNKAVAKFAGKFAFLSKAATWFKS